MGKGRRFTRRRKGAKKEADSDPSRMVIGRVHRESVTTQRGRREAADGREISGVLPRRRYGLGWERRERQSIPAPTSSRLTEDGSGRRVIWPRISPPG